jgi:hypothetical protein
MMHVGQGRAHPLHIEYVHIGVTLSLVQDVLTEAILSHPRLKMDRKIALVKALSKVIWIQNDLFAKWYVRDGEEFADDRLVPEIEPEGYLHGRKVNHDGSGSESEIEDAASTAGTCPFKNLTMNMGGHGRQPSTGNLTSSDEGPKYIGKDADVSRSDAAPPHAKMVPMSPVQASFTTSAIPRPLGNNPQPSVAA